MVCYVRIQFLWGDCLAVYRLISYIWNMKSEKSILGGSYYFFNGYPDYIVRDYDKLVLVEGLPAPILKMRRDNEDVIFIKKSSPEEMISECLKPNVPPMRCGKFLIPEFNEKIGFTIEHLLKLKPVFARMDDKHKYEKIIFNAYIKNNSFTLTKAQRDRAYREYKKCREEYAKTTDK